MKLFKFFKKEEEVKPEKPKLTSIQKLAKTNAIRLHNIRIENLNTEIEELSARLEKIESNFDSPRASKEKESDMIIRRMSLLKYEIEIREGLIRWLS